MRKLLLIIASLFFAMGTYAQPWISLVADIYPGAISSRPAMLYNYNGKLIFLQLRQMQCLH
jgi:hypothetical protein